MYALVDCNNFYVSCERVFRPDLRGKPVIVLSNNDGCVIARSNEAKAFGVQMGAPFFKVKGLCKQYNIQVFSSNYTLYGDMSNRIMRLLHEQWSDIEIYSIDEAFLDLTTLTPDQLLKFCQQLQQYLLQSTGIPTSIGIGKTKTLAKTANHLAKKILHCPVFDITNQEFLLDKIIIDEVWGIGRRWTKKLMAMGVNTAGDLARIDPHFLKNKFSVVMMRTGMELNGKSCLGLEMPRLKKSILSSKSFGSLQTELTVLQEAISCYTARAHEKLRRDKQQAKQLSVFVQSPRFRQDLIAHNQEMSIRFLHSTDDLRLLTEAAKNAIAKIYKAGVHYQKVGVMLFDLSDKSYQQIDIFNPVDNEKTLRTEKLMQVITAVNQRYGRHSLKLAAQGKSEPWSMKRQLKSPNYTTNWAELLTI